MAATPAGEQSLVFILQPLFLHGISAAAHLVLALAVAGRFLFRRLGRTLSAGRAKGGDVGARRRRPRHGRVVPVLRRRSLHLVGSCGVRGHPRRLLVVCGCWRRPLVARPGRGAGGRGGARRGVAAARCVPAARLRAAAAAAPGAVPSAAQALVGAFHAALRRRRRRPRGGVPRRPVPRARAVVGARRRLCYRRSGSNLSWVPRKKEGWTTRP